MDVQCDAVAIDISDEPTSDELYAAALRGDAAGVEPIYQSPYGYPQHQQHQQHQQPLHPQGWGYGVNIPFQSPASPPRHPHNTVSAARQLAELVAAGRSVATASMQPPRRSTQAVHAYSVHGSEIKFGGDEARNTWVPIQQVQPWERSHHRVSAVLETDSEVGTSVLSDYGDELGEEQLEELDAKPARHTMVNCRMQQRGTEHGRYHFRRRPGEQAATLQRNAGEALLAGDGALALQCLQEASLPAVLDREGVPARASVQKCQYCNSPMPLTGNRECPELSGPYNEGFGRFYHYGGYDDTRDYVDTPYCRAAGDGALALQCLQEAARLVPYDLTLQTTLARLEILTPPPKDDYQCRSDQVGLTQCDIDELEELDAEPARQNHGTELDMVKNPLVNCRMQADPTELQTRRDALQLQVAETAERLKAEKTKLEQLRETAKKEAAEEQRRAQSAAQEEAHRLEAQKRQAARQEIAAQKEAQRLASAQQATRQARGEKAERRKPVRVGYHGTTQQVAKQIIRYGFKRSTGGMLGPGVYWSDDIQKTLRYPLHSNPADRVTLLLHVRPGKTKKVNLQNHPLQQTWHDHGYDTAWVPPNNTMVGSGLSEDCTWDPTRIKVVGVSRDKGTTWEFVSDEARARHRERERVQMEWQRKEMERRKCEAALLWEQARSLVSVQNYGGAVRTFSKALSLDPHNQVLRREHDEAATNNRKEIQQIKRERQRKEMERRKSEAALLREQARSLASGKDYGGAVQTFSKALSLDPHNQVLRREHDEAATNNRKEIQRVERERQRKEMERRKSEAALLREQARSLASGKDYGGAVLKFDGALVLDPSNCGLRRERDKAATNERKQKEWAERKERIAGCMMTLAGVVSIVAMAVSLLCWAFVYVDCGEGEWGVGGCECKDGFIGDRCECTALPSSSGTTITYDGTKATYACSDGRVVSGRRRRTSTRTCQVNGSWTDSAPACEIPTSSIRMRGVARSMRIRIFGGSSRGVLEVSIDGQRWDAVCDDGFGDSEAIAFCATLGFGNSVGSTYYANHGDGSFAADDIDCPGGARSVSDCWSDRPPYWDNCRASETVGLDCSISREEIEEDGIPYEFLFWLLFLCCCWLLSK
eukprot:COSAG02_NODE_243_length_27457_cov_16.852328_21_plen_1110_part_00